MMGGVGLASRPTASPWGAPGRGKGAPPVKCVITDWDLGDPEPAARILRGAGFTIEMAECAVAEDVAKACADAEAVLCRYAPLPREVFEACPALRVVSRMGIGEWKVDLDAATDHKVAVAHCPKYCTDEAVAHTMALVLALNRRLLTCRAAAREGVWSTYPDAVPVASTSALTLGVMGLGRMGSGVAHVANALGLEVIGYDPRLPAAPEKVEMVSLDTLFEDSDILVLACPVNRDTKYIVNADRLAMMKPGSYLVNTARGRLIDEAALVAALDSGHLAGAALDVLEQEPPAPNHPLLHREDVLVTPHVGYHSEESQYELKVYAARNITHYVIGERVSGLLTDDFRRV